MLSPGLGITICQMENKIEHFQTLERLSCTKVVYNLCKYVARNCFQQYFSEPSKWPEGNFNYDKKNSKPQTDKLQLGGNSKSDYM